jgi:hypothetical protein
MDLINKENLYKVKRITIIRFKEDIINIIKIIKIINLKVIAIKIKIIKILNKRKEK